LNDNLLKKLKFIEEIEKLKTVYRNNRILNEDRYENSSEHSWHISLMALLFVDDYEIKNIDLLKTVKMLLIHDLVEIYAGDTWLYDDKARNDAQIIEKEAAKKIFGMLPQKDCKDFIELWYEFENRETPEAKYAAALDGLQPIINHSLTGKDQLTSIPKEKIIEKKSYIQEISENLWGITKYYIDLCDEKGLYKK